MTVASAINEAVFVGSGSTGPFTFTFKFYSSGDIRVVRTSVDGVDTIENGYTLTGAGLNTGGVLTLGTALATNEVLTVTRKMDFIQDTSFTNQGAFYPELHETAYDKLIMLTQQLNKDVTDVELRQSTIDAVIAAIIPDNIIASQLYTASLVMVPGNFDSLAEASVAASAVNKTIVVTSPQVVTTAIAWPADRELRFEKGGYVTFTGSGALTGLKEARPEWFYAGGGDYYTAFLKAFYAAQGGVVKGNIATTYTISPVAGAGIPIYAGTQFLDCKITLNWAGLTTGEYSLFNLYGTGYQQIKNIVIDGNKDSISFNLLADTVFNFNCFRGEAGTKRTKIFFDTVRFVDLPGAYSNTGYITGLKESFTLNLGLVTDICLSNITIIDCDTTLHIAGEIHNGIDIAANWSDNIFISNYYAKQSNNTRGMWQGFGLYGAKNVFINNMAIDGATINGLNTEWAENVIVSGLYVYNCYRAGVGGYGYNKDIIINQPIIKNCGQFTAYAPSAAISYLTGSWYTGSITGNPVSVTIDHPTVTLASGGRFATFNRGATSNIGALSPEPAALKILVDPTMGEVARTQSVVDATDVAANAPYAIIVDGAGHSINPQALTINTANTTVTYGEDYYTLTLSAQYANAYISIPKGTYGVFARVNAVAGSWLFTASPSGGTPVDFRRYVTNTTSGFSTVGMVFTATADTQVKFQCDTVGGGAINIKDFMIVPLMINSSTSFFSVPTGRIDIDKSGTGSLAVIQGTGSPENTVTARVGSLYLRSDGGESTTLYVKQSGTSNTGWVAK